MIRQIQAEPTPDIWDALGVSFVRFSFVNHGGGGGFSTDTALVTWRAYNDPDSFDVQLCSFPASDATVVSSASVAGTLRTKDMGTVFAPGDYQCRVRTVKGGAPSAWALSLKVNTA